MIAAIYLRVSSEEQTDNFSISAQSNMLKDYCKKNNITIYKEYCDDGVSAKFTDETKRPEFNQMVKDASKKLFNIILVHKYDRFARNVELSQRVKREIRKAGVNVISITEPVENSPIGFITEGLMELLAEYYIKNLSVEVKKGHLERAKQGFHNGSVPYGYRIDNKHPSKMVINKKQAKIVEYIFNCYSRLGYGYCKIARLLNESGTLGGIGGNWCGVSIKKVLINPKYIGLIKLGSNIFPGNHESIIDKDLWELTQNTLQSSSELNTHHGSNFETHFLLGISKCLYCGRAVNLKTSNGKKYYVCSGNRRTYEKVCNNTMAYRDITLHELAMREIKDICNILSPNFTIVSRNNVLESSLQKKKRLNGLLEKYEKLYFENIWTFERYKKEKDIIELEIKNIKDDIEPDKNEFQKSLKSFWEELENCKDHSEIRSKIKERIKFILVGKNGKINIEFYAI